MASVVRRASGRAGCPSGARPAPTRGYQRRPFCPRHQRVAGFRPKQNTYKSTSSLAHSGEQGNHTDSTVYVHYSVSLFSCVPRTPAGTRDACCYELARGADLGVGVGGEGVPRSPDARAGATRSLSRSCLQRSRRRSVCQGSAIWDALESPGSIGGSVRDTGAVITAATDGVGAGRRKRRKDAASSATQDTDISSITQVAG